MRQKKFISVFLRVWRNEMKFQAADASERKHANVAKEIYFCVYEMKFRAADASEKRRKEEFVYAHFQVQQPDPYQLSPLRP